MNQGVLIYALNNEQIDYVELALYAAKQVKKHLGKPVALATDSVDWLKQGYPDYKNCIDYVIKLGTSTSYPNWSPYLNYKIGDKILYKSFIYEKVKDGSEVSHELTDKLSEKVYLGIEVDKWYPNLPYLVGQHVWFNNILYRCNTEYKEEKEFSVDKYDVIIENVKDFDSNQEIYKGDIFLANRVLHMSLTNYKEFLDKVTIREDLWQNTKEKEIVYESSIQYRKYFDGALTHKRLKFKNDIRVKSFEVSPFDETLVIDSDYIINNDILKYCWEQEHGFLIHKSAVDLSGYRYDPRLHTLSDKSIDFYWATAFYFKKNQNTKIFFDLLGHIQDNWNYYRYVYQIDHALYRNDYAFSIAIHIMNGYQIGLWAQDLPGQMYYLIDKDVLLSHIDEEMKFLVEKEKYKGEYTLIKTKDINVHIMNKFSLSRTIRENNNV